MIKIHMHNHVIFRVLWNPLEKRQHTRWMKIVIDDNVSKSSRLTFIFCTKGSLFSFFLLFLNWVAFHPSFHVFYLFCNPLRKIPFRNSVSMLTIYSFFRHRRNQFCQRYSIREWFMNVMRLSMLSNAIIVQNEDFPAIFFSLLIFAKFNGEKNNHIKYTYCIYGYSVAN